MSFETALAFLAAITTILAIALTVVTVLVGYRTARLPSEISNQIDSRITPLKRELQRKTMIRLEIVESTLSLLATSFQETADRNALSEEAYILRQLIRLAADDEEQGVLAAKALYAMQARSDHKILLLARIRELLDPESAVAKQIGAHLTEAEKRLEQQVLPDS